MRVNLRIVHVSATGCHQMILFSMKCQPIDSLAVPRGVLGLGYERFTLSIQTPNIFEYIIHTKVMLQLAI